MRDQGIASGEGCTSNKASRSGVDTLGANPWAAGGVDYLPGGTEPEVNTNRLTLVVLVIDAHSVAGENHIVEREG